ncbi:UNVERIFIED_CONTAM: hypothetical protein B566_EDAN018141 [Ephemera danica]|nr:hypothetical protein B566_EDAN018141 [Ephemera danica]
MSFQLFHCGDIIIRGQQCSRFIYLNFPSLYISDIFISQNSYFNGPGTKEISLNANCINFFKNPRDQSQFSHLACQVYPKNSKFLIESYFDATESAHRNVFLVLNIDEMWPLDIIDLKRVKKSNIRYCYLLSAILLYTKSGKKVTSEFQKLMRLHKREPEKLNFDKGKEFLIKIFLDLLRANNIQYYTSNNPDIKNTEKFIDILPMVIASYNNSVHSTTKFAPSNVKDKNVLEIWRNMNGNKK